MTEVDAMLVKLLGDGTDFDAMMRKADSMMDVFDRAQDKARRKTEDFINSLKNFSVEITAMGFALQNIGNKLQSTFLGFAKGSFDASVSFDRMMMGLEAVAGSSGAAESQLARLREVAKLPGLGLEEAVQGSLTLQAVGVDAMDAERALKAFGGALAVVGKGRVELAGVNLAISQIFSKGKVQAEEINQIAERMPQIRGAMMSAFGTADTQELQKMGLTPEKFLQGVIQELEKLPGVADNASNKMENLGDSWTQFMVSVGKATETLFLPILDATVQLVDWLNNLDDKWKVLIGTVSALLGVAGSLIASLGSLAIAIGGVAFAAKGLGLNLTTASLSMRTMATSAGTLSKTLLLSKTSLASMGVGLVAVGGYYAMVQPHIDKYNEALKEGQKLQEKITKMNEDRHKATLEGIGDKRTAPEKLAAVQEALAMARKNVSGQEDSLNRAKGNLANYKNPAGDFLGISEFFYGNQEKEMMKAEVESRRAEYNAGQAKVKELEDLEKELAARVSLTGPKGDLGLGMFDEMEMGLAKQRAMDELRGWDLMGGLTKMFTTGEAPVVEKNTAFQDTISSLVSGGPVGSAMIGLERDIGLGIPTNPEKKTHENKVEGFLGAIKTATEGMLTAFKDNKPKEVDLTDGLTS